jgi:hypothetical protein
MIPQLTEELGFTDKVIRILEENELQTPRSPLYDKFQHFRNERASTVIVRPSHFDRRLLTI